MNVPLDPLTPSQEDIALEEISYSREQLADDLSSLKDWLSTQHHFPPSAAQEPDAFFCNFLVGCKGEMNRAKEKIDKYYRFRSRAKDFCSVRDPLEPKSAAMWPHFQLLTLPKPTPDGCRVLMTISGIPDYPEYDPTLIIKRILTIMEMRLRCEVIQGGEYLIMDSSNYSTSYFLTVRPNFIRNVIYFLQNIIPWRIKGIVSFNTPPFLNTIINRLLKPLIKTKIARRWHVYSEGHEILTKHFPLEILPSDYGGEAENIQRLSDTWMERASTSYWRNWFINEGSETVVEEEENRNGLLTFKGFWS